MAEALDWPGILRRVEAAIEPHRGAGKVADYIPALACIDPNKFGMAVALADGQCHCVGDAEEAFSLQSISKIFTLSLALKAHADRLWERVGREPSGSAFNSIVQLEHEGGIPRNPLINAGAIVITDLLVSAHGASLDGPDAAVAHLLQRLRWLAQDDSVMIDETVARSEAESGARNRALAHFMTSFGNIENPVETTLSAYFQHCAIAISCRQLARASLFLAFDGRDPVTGEAVLSPERCRQINAVMMMAGHYDNSGDFAYRIGLPGKSGVGGGILVVAPGHGTVASWSPGLNAAGTSMVGSLALETLVGELGWSVFAP